MADSILKSIALQRKGLETEISTLKARIDNLLAEIYKLDKAEAALRGMSVTTFKTVGLKPELLNPELTKPAEEDKTKLPTIKQMVLVVLKDHPNGMLALDILETINDRYKSGYSRTSLSPQLSRLRQDNQVHKKGKRWMLGPSPLSDSEASGMD